MHVYEIAPIDFSWMHLKTVEQTLKELPSRDSESWEGPCREEFEDAWRDAQDSAGEAGWDGDFSRPPVVFWLPVESEFEFGFVIKQNSNGATFVMSPRPLPHLEIE